MKYIVLASALALGSAACYGQAPPAPAVNPAATPQKQTPSPQAPVTQLYRLVPVDQPVATPQQYQTVQLVTAPQQYQTVQVAAPVQQVQQVQYVPSSQSTFAVAAGGTRTIVMGPGPLSLAGAWVGSRLVGLGKTHVWNISHSVVRPQVQPAPPVQQLVTVSMPQPVVQQPVQVQVVQQPVQQPVQQYRINAPSEDAPPPPVVPVPTKPSPQTSVQAPKHHLFGWSN